jgi:hypothetical protein
MHLVSGGWKFQDAIESLMNQEEALKLVCKKTCNGCDAGQVLKRVAPTSAHTRKGIRMSGGEIERIEDMVDPESLAIGVFQNELKDKINASGVNCLLCKSRTTGTHFASSCNGLRALNVRNKCGYCLDHTQHASNDYVHCCLLDSKTCNVCVMCFREKNVCQKESCNESPVWKSTRLVMMAVFFDKSKLEALQTMHNRFEGVVSFKDFFKRCTDEYVLVNNNRFSMTILVLVFAYRVKLISF